MAKLTMNAITPQSVEDVTASKRIYEVKDKQDRTLGFVASRKQGKKGTVWGFTVVPTAFKRYIHYSYENRVSAVEALLSLRAVKADTGKITVIK